MRPEWLFYGKMLRPMTVRLMKRSSNILLRISKSNIRELEGAFNKIIAFAKLNKVDLTLSLAEEALKDVIYPNKPKEITPTLIINVVAEHLV